jgi:hypothetical protein
MTTDAYPAYRIAVRQEGAWIVAYVAQMETMDGAIKIATLLKSSADVDRAIFDAWLDFLQGHVDRMFSAIIGSHALRFTRNKPNTLEPVDRQPYDTPETAIAKAEQAAEVMSGLFATMSYRAPDPAPSPPPFQSGGGGDFAGAGASGSWDAPAPPSSCAAPEPPPPPPPSPAPEPASSPPPSDPPSSAPSSCD